MKLISTFVFGLFFFSKLSAGTLLTFAVSEESRVPKEEELIQTNDQYEMKVYLGKSLLDMQTKDEVRILDFGKRRIYRQKKGMTGFVSLSLFSDIGFRVYEFQNRKILGGALEKAGVKENPMDRVLMEHLFSLSSDQDPKLTRTVENKLVAFKHNDKQLLRYSLDVVPVEDADKKRYMLFLRYRYGIHPRILEELAEVKGLPEELVVYQYNIGTEKFNLKLLSAAHSAGPPERALTPFVSAGEGPVYDLCRKFGEFSKEDYAQACIRMKAKAVKNAKAGNLLDAFVMFLGYTLATGEQMPKEFFEFKAAMMNDDDIKLILKSLSPQSKETAEQAVLDLNTLLEKSKDGASTLLIFRANILTTLGKQTEALDSFLDALSKEPMILGAWKDLGDIYYGKYDTETAWQFWDTGRALNPEHPLFKDVNQFEKRLQTDHPEFFLPGSLTAN